MKKIVLTQKYEVKLDYLNMPVVAEMDGLNCLEVDETTRIQEKEGNAMRRKKKWQLSVPRTEATSRIPRGGVRHGQGGVST